MPSAPEYPRLVKNGSVVVKVYRVRQKTTASGWAYSVAWVSGGRRRLQQFADEGSAMEEARVKAGQIAEGRQEVAELSRSDRDDIVAARELCDGVPLLSALEEWRKARAITQGHIIPAAEAWAARNSTKFTRIKVADAIEAFIAAKNKAGKQGERTYRAKLDPLKEFFPDRHLDSITVTEFTAYLERYDDAVTRNDLRKRAGAMCRWAQRHGFLPKHVTLEIDATERAAEKKTKIGILTPATYGQLLRFFHQNHSEFLGALVLAGFCGIRSDEIHGKREDKREKRQLWEDIHLKRKFVQVTNAKTNTAGWRIVQLCDAAAEWLELCPAKEGTVCDAGAMEKVRLLAIEAGFELPDNCFRHSFISYRIAVTGDKPKVATEAGNSVGEIDRRYRVPLPEDQGKAWFGMNPSRVAKLPELKLKSAA